MNDSLLFEDNFADIPKSIGELRSAKADSAKHWTPRDALVSMLRDIDKGLIDLDVVVIFSRHRRVEPDGLVNQSGYLVSSPDFHTTIGVVTTSTAKLIAECQRIV
jgi:hypothetical protein